MSEMYTVIYYIERDLRPKTWQTPIEDDAIRFAAGRPGSVIRRDSDNSYLDMVSGTWIKIVNSPST